MSTRPRDLEVVARGDILGECVTWCERTQSLWWVDIFRPGLNMLTPESGASRRHALPGQTLGSFALRDAGGMLLALDDTLQVFDPANGSLRVVYGPESGSVPRRFNDGRCDRQGRFWVGSMDRDVTVANGVVQRFGSDFLPHRMFGDFKVPNSAAFSPDGETYYFSDCRNRLIWAHRIDTASGDIIERRQFAETRSHPGQPDGSCVDADGYLWNAEYNGGRLIRFAPDGRIDRIIELPVSKPTSCAFGGKALDILYVTTAVKGLAPDQAAAQPLAGSLLAFRPGVRGVPDPYFRDG